MQSIVMLIMGINIFMSIPFLIGMILKKKKVAILIALFFGSFAYFSVIPKNSTHDLKSYYILFETLNFYANEEFLNKQLYVKILFTFLNKLSLPKEMIPFITNFITYYLLVKIYENNSKLIIKSRDYFVFFCLFLFIMPFFGYLGVRYYTAIVVYIYGFLKPRKKKYKFFIMLISIFIHYTMVIPLIIYLFTKIIKTDLVGKKLRIILIIVFILGYLGIDRILIDVIEKLNLNSTSTMIKAYILGKWGNSYFQQFHGIRLYVYLLERSLRIIYMFLLCYLLSYKKYRKFDWLEKNVIFLSIFCILIQNYRTLFDRFCIYTLILSFIMIINNANIMNTKWLRKIVFFSIFILALINFIILFERFNNVINLYYRYSFGKILYDVILNIK